jgi:hypothetical protein
MPLGPHLNGKPRPFEYGANHSKKTQSKLSYMKVFGLQQAFIGAKLKCENFQVFSPRNPAGRRGFFLSE